MSGLILFEDEHILAVNKPSGINTHKSDTYAPNGIHEWLTLQNSRWAKLTIVHRLDKDTSGIILFGKTSTAVQSLTKQFKKQTIDKSYLLLSTSQPTRRKLNVHSGQAITEFERIGALGKSFLIRAKPKTGKTHQIRKHSSRCGFPILGDRLFHGQHAWRLMLHAESLRFDHPVTRERLHLHASVPQSFEFDDPIVVAKEFRILMFSTDSDVYRLISGLVDGYPGVNVDRYGTTLFVQWQSKNASEKYPQLCDQLAERCNPEKIIEQFVTKRLRTSPKIVWKRSPYVKRANEHNTDLSDRYPVRENGLQFLIGFNEGLSTGLFPDQRDNRTRLQSLFLQGKSVLNCFSYTCAFSVAAAKLGANTTSVDLSRRYLAWGKDNFAANGINASRHEFVTGDVFEWLRRFHKQGRRWDLILLDPPTFSTTKKGTSFRADHDYADLVATAIPVVAAGGMMFCSTNQRTLRAEKFEADIKSAVERANRAIVSLEYQTLPPDFRVALGEYPYLKTFWVRLE